MNSIKNIVWIILLMTGMRLSALPLPSFWKSRVQNNAQKVIAQETPKLAAALKNGAVSVARTVGQKTLQAAGSVAKTSLKEGAQFAWHHPKIAAGLVAGGYLYYKKDDIGQWCKEKYQQYKPFVWGAAGLAAVAGAAVAAQKVANNWDAVQSSIQSLSKYATRNQAAGQASNAVKSAVSADEFAAVANDVWNEIEAAQSAPVPVLPELPAAGHIILPAVDEASAQIPSIPAVASENFEQAWHDVQNQPIQESIVSSHSDDSFRLPATVQEQNEATDLAENFSNEFKPRVPLRTHVPPVWDADQIKALAQEQSGFEKHPWITEFKKQESNAHSLQEWLDEYNAKQNVQKKQTLPEIDFSDSEVSIGSVEDFKQDPDADQPQLCANGNAIARINRFLKQLYPPRIASL